MTVISDKFTDLAGIGDSGAVSFYAPGLRDAGSGAAIITGQWVHVPVAPDGSFTSPPLEPGPALVRVGGVAHPIEVPDYSTPVRLWPLIAAGGPPVLPPEAQVVLNFGGVAGLRVVTTGWFDTHPHDPDTVYILIPN